jgi:surfactin synthase thioesterase subunit
VLSATFDVVVFQYPGRQDRATEAPSASLREIAAGAFDAFWTSPHNHGGPIVTFGHSMGAGVAFAFVRIAEPRGVDVRQLVASAAVAPWKAATKRRRPTDDEGILNHLAELAGTNSHVSADRELMRLALPVMKADYRACNGYSCAETVKVAAPIHVMGGERDPVITLGDLYGWAKHTDAVEVTMFDGGHFYLSEHLGAVNTLLASYAHREQAA